MTLTEPDAGITEYLNERVPFRAILKQQIDDFIVNEITSDGLVVHQKSLRVPKIESTGNEDVREVEKTEDSNDTIAAQPTPSAGIVETTTETGTPLKRKLSESNFSALDDIFAKESTKPSVALKSALEGFAPVFTFPPLAEGEEMEALSKWVTDNLPNYKAERYQSTPRETSSEWKLRILQSTKSDRGAVKLMPDYEILDSIFPIHNPKPSESLKTVLDEEGTEFAFPALLDKNKRAKLHKWVRDNIPKFDSDTVEVDGEKAVRIRKRSTIPPWKRRRRDSVDRPPQKRHNNDPLWVSRNDYVECTLWKRGRDTIEALSTISSILRVPDHVLSHAGTKDKRGVTVQNIRIRGIPLKRLARVNNARHMFYHGRRCLAIGDFSILRSGRPLSLGDLRGNRFTLVLRDVSGSEELVNNAMDHVQKFGFINYFGMQRFGSGVSPTHHTGFAVLRGDFKEACIRILTPLTVASTECSNLFELRPERHKMESALAEFIADRCTGKDLYDRLPRWMNIERIMAKSFADDEHNNRKRDYKAAFGKLPRNLRRIYGHSVQSYLWNCMASKRIALFKHGDPHRHYGVAGDLVAADDGITSFNFSTKVRAVTKDEEKSRSVCIDRVLIPVIGSKVEPPDTVVGGVAKDILRKEGINLKRISAEYDIKGLYRRLVCKPENLEYSWKLYDAQSREPLVHHNVDREGQETRGDDEKERDASNEHRGIKGAPSRALIVSFSLALASYATMLVRELTRSETSVSYQKRMQTNQTEANE